ncbi:MAG: GNAT family N-acetyltransferase [Robiginitomaculum sp.]
MKIKLSAKTLNAISDVSRDDWNALLPPCGAKDYHPFTDWDFLNALEISGSAYAQTGWKPLHIRLEDEKGRVRGVMPLYGKSHSQGEYVFDHGWADAAERSGLPYYPKLQCAVPFTPAPGPRLLAQSTDAKQALVDAAHNALSQFNLSGLHLTFLQKDDLDVLKANDFLIRTDRQFHFINRGYKSFDNFLGSLTARKRKKIKSERRRACETVVIKRLRGDDIKPFHWDAFYQFYQNTSMRKWGQPYLTRNFFAAIHESMREQVLLVLAYQDETLIAGALNFIGGDTLYGRHWGALTHIPFLHFELCYYQAIEAGIDMELARVEAGAQGEHKLARGYEPVPTYSAHQLAHPNLHNAVSDFLTRERKAVDAHINVLSEFTPFRKGGPK